MNNKPRVLLVHGYGPNDLGWGEDMYDLLTARLARGHGPFQMTSHCHYFALYMIAENISNPTTVLENPHWSEFTRELNEGYEVVGFQLKSVHTAKIARMMRHIREHHPNTKIVVGGYGVGTLWNIVPGDTNGDGEYIRENADYLCREEGVKFMRRILDDEPIDREITQYHLPMAGFSMQGFKAHARAPMILVSLGCPNACDFCNTSAFFNHKKFYVAEPEQVYRYMKHYQKRLGYKDVFPMLFDEDFFLNTEYVRELGRLIRSDKNTWGVKYFTFGGVRSLSQFEPEELRDCGLGAVWIGVESFMCGQQRPDDPYGKRQGAEIKELFKQLHSHGIETTASLVLGFDFHTPDNLKEDIDQFVSLKPMLYQISPLTPCPGTPLYDRMAEEDRILDTYKWEDIHLWKDDVFKLKNFKQNEIKEYFDYAHEKIRDELGPPALQSMEAQLDSYQELKDKSDDFHAFHADRTRGFATGAYSFLRSVQQHHPSEKVRERADMLEKRYKDEIGEPPWYTGVASRYLSRKIKKNKENPRHLLVSDPPPRWSYYNTFDDRVWVKKGRKAKKPAPYKEPQMIGYGVDWVIKKFTDNEVRESQ